MGLLVVRQGQLRTALHPPTPRRRRVRLCGLMRRSQVRQGAGETARKMESFGWRLPGKCD